MNKKLYAQPVIECVKLFDERDVLAFSTDNDVKFDNNWSNFWGGNN